MFRFAVTIFVSAFLLFQVQPLIGRFILPWFGGGPSIWTSCMLFFQILLLGGYLYAHLTSVFLKTKTQVIVHLSLLGASLLFLPIAPSDSWKPTADQSPLTQILLLLLATVGGPYFVLSSTGPLMQKWFSQAEPGKSPYRLYALSNIGSLLALLSYPFVFEPWLKLREQTWSWSGVYLIYGGLVAWCAAKLWAIASKDAPVEAAVQNPTAGQSTAMDDGIRRPGIGSMLLWLGLAASSSIMLLATTNQLCIDVATVPFLWILPLCLYLISFIICFDSPQWYDRRVYGLLLLVCCPLAVWILSDGAYANIGKQVVIYSSILFVCCMVCHGELVSCRPHEKYLTLFYVLVSAGGAVGGLFVAMVAPAVFDGYWEYSVGLVAVCVTTLLAWCSQKIWLRRQSPEFWAWMVVTVLNILMVRKHLYGPLLSPGDADGIDATDEVILFGVFGLLQFAGLLLTSVLSYRRTALMVTWFTIAIVSSVWLACYSHWKLDAFVESKTIEVEKDGGVSEIETRELSDFGIKALGILAVSAFASAFVAKDLANMMLLPSDVVRRVVLYAGILLLLFSDWLEEWQFISLAFTVVSGFLMELSAAGFRGRDKPSIGFWFWVPAITLTLMLGNQLKEIVDEDDKFTVHVSRNFYGVLRVRLESATDYVFEEGGEDRTIERTRHSLTHGQIKHGFQYLQEEWTRTPTTYYGRKSGIGLAIENRRAAAKSAGRGVRVGVVGLGTGTIAAYCEKGDYFRFYDINPDVLKLSNSGVFTYLNDAPEKPDVEIGDARIVMERELQNNKSQQFDVLAIDAFSSDAIPVHLLTSECGEIYKQHIRTGGILAVHISNRYLNLSPVTRGMADKLQWQAARISNNEDDNEGVFSSTWILLSSDPAVLAQPDIQSETEDWDDEDAPLHWTDDYSGLWQVLTL
jgi:hypothetical protein